MADRFSKDRSTKSDGVRFSNETDFLAWVAGRKLSTFTINVNAVLDGMIRREISKVCARRVTEKSTNE
jgi:hypothetical protein